MSWYVPRKGPKKAADGIRLRKTTLAGDAWWSQEWISKLKSITDKRRLERGLAYAAAGQVLSVQVTQGFAEALVQGSRAQPYKVEIGLQMLSTTQAKRAADAMMKKAYYIAKLLAGEFPHEIADIFDKTGTPLFPQSEADISSDCSCPDDAATCKHVAAALYILGQEFDRDPFLLLEMRGLNRAQLLAEIQMRRAAGKSEKINNLPTQSPPKFPAQTILSSQLHDFYDAPKDHPLAWKRSDNFLAQLPPPGGRIKELGSPPFWQSDHDFQEVLKGIYLAVRKRATSSP